MKSPKVYPYFLMCLRCFFIEKNIRIKKYISRKGQYTGIKKKAEKVHRIDTTITMLDFFQRLNYVMLLTTGLSFDFIVKGISKYNLRYPHMYCSHLRQDQGDPLG